MKAKKSLKTKGQMRRAAHRPSTFSPVIALRIIKRMSHGETLRSICRDDDMPHFDTVYSWQSKLAEFADAFAQARVVGTHNLADECLEIADRKGLDPQDRRVMIDTRLRLIGMWNRRDYGEKRELDVHNSISLGDLVEASYKRLEERGQQPNTLDITPQIEAPHTDDISALDKRARRVAT